MAYVDGKEKPGHSPRLFRSRSRQDKAIMWRYRSCGGSKGFPCSFAYSEANV